ncbi:MAG: transcriptional regulator [Chloroflexota bacterium]
MQQPQEAEIRMLHAQVCQALADPTRILLLYQLAAALGTSQPTVSRHLKVLRERGMARAERLGTTVMYSLTDVRVIQALDLMRAVLEDTLAQRGALATILGRHEER